MEEMKKRVALIKEECQIVKALLEQKWHHQDIPNLLNIGREATINSARITKIKKDTSISPDSDEDVNFFRL